MPSAWMTTFNELSDELGNVFISRGSQAQHVWYLRPSRLFLSWYNRQNLIIALSEIHRQQNRQRWNSNGQHRLSKIFCLLRWDCSVHLPHTLKIANRGINGLHLDGALLRKKSQLCPFVLFESNSVIHISAESNINSIINVEVMILLELKQYVVSSSTMRSVTSNIIDLFQCSNLYDSCPSSR